jgi:hypothetical protein
MRILAIQPPAPLMRCGMNSLAFGNRWRIYVQGSSKASHTTIAGPSGRYCAYKRALKQNFMP